MDNQIKKLLESMKLFSRVEEIITKGDLFKKGPDIVSAFIRGFPDREFLVGSVAWRLGHNMRNAYLTRYWVLQSGKGEASSLGLSSPFNNHGFDRFARTSLSYLSQYEKKGQFLLDELGKCRSEQFESGATIFQLYLFLAAYPQVRSEAEVFFQGSEGVAKKFLRQENPHLQPDLVAYVKRQVVYESSLLAHMKEAAVELFDVEKLDQAIFKELYNFATNYPPGFMEEMRVTSS